MSVRRDPEPTTRVLFDVAGATVLPFLIQAFLAVLAVEVHPVFARWLGIVLPVGIGFFFLERRLGLGAIGVSVVYVPAMFSVLMLFSFDLIGRLYDLWP